MSDVENMNLLSIAADHPDEDLFRLMAENSPRGMLFIHQDRVSYCNTKACEILDIDKAELRNMSVNTFSARLARPEDQAWFRMVVQRDPGVQPLYGCEVSIVDRTGNQRWLEISCMTVMYKGTPAFQAEFVDISLRRMTEIALYNEIHRSTVINNLQTVLLSGTERPLYNLLEMLLNTFMADSVWLLRAIDIDFEWLKVVEHISSDAEANEHRYGSPFKLAASLRQPLEDKYGIIDSEDANLLRELGISSPEYFPKVLISRVQVRSDLPWLLVFVHSSSHDIWTASQKALLLDVCRQTSIILMRWRLQTELNNRSIELQTEHNLTSALFRFSPMPSAVYDPFHNHIVKANEKWIDAVGYPIGQDAQIDLVLKLLLADTVLAEQHITRLHACWEDGLAYLDPIDWGVDTRQGQRVWRIFHVPIQFHDEHNSLWLITVVDVTERSNAERALAQRNDELKILSDFSVNVVQSLTPETIMTDALHQLLLVFQAQFGSIYLYEPETGECKQMRSLGTPEQLNAFAEIITINDLVRKRREWEELQQHNLIEDKITGVGSWVSIPLRSADIHYGMAMIGHEEAYFFDNMSHEMLSTIGRTIGIAVENSRLFEATLQGAMELSVLVDAIHTISSELDLKNTLFRLANTLGERLGIAQCLVWLYDQALDEMVLSAYYWGIEYQNTVQLGLRIPVLDAPIWGEILMRKQPVFIGRVTDFARWDFMLGASTREHKEFGIQAKLMVPIMKGDHLMGVITLNITEPLVTPVSYHLTLTERIARYAAVAMENARLYEATVEARDRMEQKVIERTEQLEVANRELQTFAYTVSHDLKAPLRAIEGYSSFLEHDYVKLLDAKGLHYLQNLRTAAVNMHNIINDLLVYAQVDQREQHLRPIVIRPLIDSLVATVSNSYNQVNITVSIDLSFTTLYSEAEGLREVLHNLIENAFKFSVHQPQPEVRIWGEETSDAWRLHVKDNGIGFDMRYHDQVFRIFHRLQRTEDYPGTGVGLAIVSRIVDRLKGRVWAESTLGQGATFHVVLPKVGEKESD